MKEVLSPFSIMEMMVDKLQKNYPEHEKKADGVIQFHLTHDNQKYDCYINASKDELIFNKGIHNSPTVSVKSSFYNWLDLAGGKLNQL